MTAVRACSVTVCILAAGAVPVPVSLLLSVAVAALVGASSFPCPRVCPYCAAHRHDYESRVGAHLPSLALWHRVGASAGRSAAAAVVIFVAALGAGVLAAGPLSSSLVFDGPVDAVRFGMAVAAGVMLWWYLGHRDTHGILKDVCPYCRH